MQQPVVQLLVDLTAAGTASTGRSFLVIIETNSGKIFD
jgi:hypothetical protein